VQTPGKQYLDGILAALFWMIGLAEGFVGKRIYGRHAADTRLQIPAPDTSSKFAGGDKLDTIECPTDIHRVAVREVRWRAMQNSIGLVFRLNFQRIGYIDDQVIEF